MTTVGYGEVYPHSDAGRVIAIAVMLVGIGFLSILIGAVAERFVAIDVREETRHLGAEEALLLREETRHLEADEALLLREVRDLGERLSRIEAALERRSGS
jgi:voltage-gated potassium channel Kch